MVWLVKWVLLALAAFAVYTAEPEQKDAMYNGVKAFGAAVVTACTRPESLCTNAISAVREQINPTAETAVRISGPVPPLEPREPRPGDRDRDPFYPPQRENRW